MVSGLQGCVAMGDNNPAVAVNRHYDTILGKIWCDISYRSASRFISFSKLNFDEFDTFRYLEPRALNTMA